MCSSSKELPKYEMPTASGFAEPLFHTSGVKNSGRTYMKIWLPFDSGDISPLSFNCLAASFEGPCFGFASSLDPALAIGAFPFCLARALTALHQNLNPSCLQDSVRGKPAFQPAWRALPASSALKHPKIWARHIVRFLRCSRRILCVPCC